MAGGGYVVNGSTSNSSNGRLTMSVIITCIVAASGGLIFGYDIGISGGVTTMEPFLRKFFPSVLRKMADAKHNTYCVYDSQVLTAFTSSLYLAGLASSLVASFTTKRMGRKYTMVLGGCTFFIGAVINGAAINIMMLILGRIFLGIGVGFTNQATPVYLSEMAPPKWRGAFTIGFQFFLGTGVVVANVINYRTAQIGSWGWRLSLGLAAVPAVLMTIGALLVSDTPSSLVERGKLEQAKQSLQRARGVGINIEDEFIELLKSSEDSKLLTNEPFTTIFQRQYRPHLVMAVLIPFFQQLTGINVIAFYAPVIFQSVGFGSNSALVSAIILGLVNLGSIVMSMFVVDRFGRRVLFMEGGIQMVVFQVCISFSHPYLYLASIHYACIFASLTCALLIFIADEGCCGMRPRCQARGNWRPTTIQGICYTGTHTDVYVCSGFWLVMGTINLAHTK
ncbi:hypothetical protein AQUCO_00201288v1 [Aquilegia coerulea]|uniref:Major facilitator superfamily (MFS) profile domain-containing protein n=1 Tax=Aquilegia coerulea TaxID=218851 RepID=A0A2G5F7E6_AQUCA|nr:hypothetical protein AQUCO_00201288v1 [Aquilegia coerulea]